MDAWILEVDGSSGPRPRLVLRDVIIQNADVGIEAYAADVDIAHTKFLTVHTAIVTLNSTFLALDDVFQDGGRVVHGFGVSVDVLAARRRSADRSGRQDVAIPGLLRRAAHLGRGHRGRAAVGA